MVQTAVSALETAPHLSSPEHIFFFFCWEGYVPSKYINYLYTADVHVYFMCIIICIYGMQLGHDILLMDK